MQNITLNYYLFKPGRCLIFRASTCFSVNRRRLRSWRDSVRSDGGSLLSSNNCEKKLNILEEGGTVNTDLMKKILINYYIGLLTLETDNLCTALLVRDLLPGVWLAVAGISFLYALHSPLIGSLGLNCEDRIAFQIASFIFESHFYHPIILETFVCKMSATDYGVFCRL